MGYTLDAHDRRSATTLPDGQSWIYTYDDLGQVTSGTLHDAEGKAIPGNHFAYTYDEIGNRRAAALGIQQRLIEYTSNDVNQYLTELIPGVVPVTGEADPEALVKAISTSAPGTSAQFSITSSRDGQYFSGYFTVNNQLAPVTLDFNVYAKKGDPDDPTTDLVRKLTESVQCQSH